jgi:hypothetical protein
MIQGAQLWHPGRSSDISSPLLPQVETTIGTRALLALNRSVCYRPESTGNPNTIVGAATMRIHRTRRLEARYKTKASLTRRQKSNSCPNHPVRLSDETVIVDENDR